MRNKGFIALTSLVIISALIFAFEFTYSTEYVHFLDLVQKKEYRLIAYYNAYSCIDMGILMISHDYFINTSEAIVFDDLNCKIISITNSEIKNNFKIISVMGEYNKVSVFRLANVRVYDDHLEIISIK